MAWRRVHRDPCRVWPVRSRPSTLLQFLPSLAVSPTRGTFNSAPSAFSLLPCPPPSQPPVCPSVVSRRPAHQPSPPNTPESTSKALAGQTGPHATCQIPGSPRRTRLPARPLQAGVPADGTSLVPGDIGPAQRPSRLVSPGCYPERATCRPQQDSFRRGRVHEHVAFLCPRRLAEEPDRLALTSRTDRACGSPGRPVRLWVLSQRSRPADQLPGEVCRAGPSCTRGSKDGTVACGMRRDLTEGLEHAAPRPGRPHPVADREPVPHLPESRTAGRTGVRTTA